MPRRLPLLSAIGLVALAGAAVAGPARPHEAWASGRIARVDAATRSVVVSQGTHEMTFVLAPEATVVQGRTVLAASDLGTDIGRAVKVRYSLSFGSKVADRVVLGQPSTASLVRGRK